jgi:outer membrane lipoprotein-sorting protein
MNTLEETLSNPSIHAGHAMRRPGHFIVATAVLLVTKTAVLSAESNLQARALAAFENVEKKFEQVQTLQYKAERVSSTRRQTVTENWTLSLHEPDSVRLDYRAAQERLIVANPSSLWEYAPSVRKVQHTDLRSLPVPDRNKLLLGVLAKVSIDGIRLGSYQELVRGVTRIVEATNAANTVTVEGQGPRFAVTVDMDRGILLETEIYDTKGNLKLRTRASDFLEISKGFWYPQHIEATYCVSDELVVRRITLSGIAVNAPMSADTFQFVPPKFVTVIVSKSSGAQEK